LKVASNTINQPTRNKCQSAMYNFTKAITHTTFFFVK